MKNRKLNRLNSYNYSQAGYYFVTICTHNRVNLFGNIVDGTMIINDAGCMISRIWKEIPYYYSGFKIDEYIIMPNHIHGILIIDPVGTDPRVCPSSNTTEPIDIGVKFGQTQGSVPTGVDRFDEEPAHIGVKFGQSQGVVPAGVDRFDVEPIDIGVKFGQSRGVVPAGVDRFDEEPAHIGVNFGQTQGSVPTGLSGVIQRFKSLTTRKYIDGVNQYDWISFNRQLWQRSFYDHIIRDEISINKIRTYIMNNPLNWKSDENNIETKSIETTLTGTTPVGTDPVGTDPVGTDPRVCPFTITINGENREVISQTVSDLLLELGLEPKITIVEKNLEILRQADYGQVSLAPGDILELIRFMGGG